MTSRVAEFNDVPGLERELRHGDVAAVLMEPALTNIGIVLPEPGYLDAVRQLTSDQEISLSSTSSVLDVESARGTEQYRNRQAQRLALMVNRRTQRFFREHRATKRALRRIY